MGLSSRNPRILVPIALLAGLVLGYAAGRWQYRPPDGLLQPRVQARLPATASPEAATADAAVPVDLPVQLADANQVIVATTRGLLLAPGDRLVLPLVALHQARQGVFRLNGQVFPLGGVTGVNAEAGLAVVETGLSPESIQDAGLVLNGSASLYLGLELDMLSAGENFEGWVDTAAQQGAGGQTVYGVRSRASQPLLLSQPEQAGLTALMLPGTRILAGMLTGTEMDSGLYEAVDASALTTLAAPAPDHKGPVSIAGFSSRFFTQTIPGRLLSLKAAAGQGDWARVTELGPALLAMSPGADVVDILERGYLEQVRAALNDRDAATALQILDTADAVLPPGAPLANARANSLFVANRPLEALDVLHRTIDNGSADSTTYALAQNLVQMLTDGDRLSQDKKQQLLEQAVTREPAVAFYHARLGETLYRQGRYAEALTQLNYALQLDASLHDELQALMNNARARLQTPDRVIVPLTSDGNAYYIDAVIDGTPRRLLLDTGASFTAVSANLARELGFRVPADAPRVQLNTANGVIMAPMITVDSLSVNGATVANLDVVVIDNMNGNGLLGLNFLNHFNIDIDQLNAEMTLRRR